MKASTTSGLILIVMLLGLSVLAGCKPAQAPVVRETIFYPPAPDLPRIQFLVSFSDPQIWEGRKKSSFSDFIVGAEAAVEEEQSEDKQQREPFQTCKKFIFHSADVPLILIEPILITFHSISLRS